MKYTADFVIKVNEIYHDVEGRTYENIHSEIFVDEVERWRKIGKQFIADSPGKITLLDIGSGTGFVPLTIGYLLNGNDLCVCSDVSSKMLDVCRENLSNRGFKCDLKFLKVDGKQINYESNYFSHITLNSVLHHIPDFSSFFNAIDKLLQIHGRLIIGHEPNKVFYTSRLLWINSKLWSVFMNPKLYVAHYSRRLGLIKAPIKVRKDREVAIMKSKQIIEDVNKRLLEAGVIKEALTGRQIIAITDIHSPTAGRFHKRRGISISELLQEYLPNYEIEHFETYNHLGKVSSQNRFTKGYDSLLKKLFPKGGVHFLVVLKKVRSL